MIKCLLDMDGVLVNFVKGICAAHNRTDPYEQRHNLGFFDMDKIWQMPAHIFWEPTRSPEFWANLEPMKNADAIMEIVLDTFGPEQVCLLTAPTADIGNCVAGKHAWVMKHYPDFRKRILFGSAKQFCAHDQSVLVDDKDKNIEVFRKHEGVGVLVPRPWNSMFDKAHSLQPIKERLEML